MITFQIKGSPQLQATLAKLGADAPRAVGSALYREAEQIMARSKELVPVDEDILRPSGHVQLPKVTPTGATVTLGYGGAASKYAIYIHEGIGPAVGRPAFMPPASALRGWVKRNIGGTEKEIDRISFLVARAIGRRGLKPTKFLERPFKQAQAGMEGRLGARVRQWIEMQAKVPGGAAR